MRLTLSRPLAFIDLETTGTNRATDRIIEMTVCKLFPDLTRDLRTWLMNPGMEIPQESINIHGITNDKVKNCLHFSDFAPNSILPFLEGCDIAGFNSNSFDVPMLFHEFARCGIYWDYSKFKMVDAGNIYKINESRTLSSGYKFYCDKTLSKAHTSEADTLATVEIFLAQMEKYDLPQTVEELALYSNYNKPVLDLSGKFSLDDGNNIIFNFGPNKGKRASNHLDFVLWMTMKEFPRDTLSVCEKLLSDARQIDEIIDHEYVDKDGLPF
jgi:DNA polymerase-3 subunit epsilon